MTPLLSIIVPTRNRFEYLWHLTDLFVMLKDNSIELIIQDNSDNNEEIKRHINACKDDRIKYFYTLEHLSVIQNSDQAVKNSSGEYVCFLGDDDGFLPEIVQWTIKMKENNVDALLPEKAMYFWPDIEHKYHKLNGFVTFQKYSKEWQPIDVKKQIRKVLKSGGTFMYRLPRLYHGIVSRNILNMIYLKTNTFFPGPSPDMANAIALSLYVKKAVYLNRPIVISGKGHKSTGGKGLRHQHVGKIEDIGHLPKDTSINWEELNPKIWTGFTIYAESTIKSLKRNGREDLLLKFNWNSLYGYFLAKHSNLKNKVLIFIDYKNIMQVYYHYISLQLYRVLQFALNFYKTKNDNSIFRKTNIKDIAHCTEYIRQVMEAR